MVRSAKQLPSDRLKVDRRGHQARRDPLGQRPVPDRGGVGPGPIGDLGHGGPRVAGEDFFRIFAEDDAQVAFRLGDQAVTHLRHGLGEVEHGQAVRLIGTWWV